MSNRIWLLALACGVVALLTKVSCQHHHGEDDSVSIVPGIRFNSERPTRRADTPILFPTAPVRPGGRPGLLPPVEGPKPPGLLPDPDLNELDLLLTDIDSVDPITLLSLNSIRSVDDFALLFNLSLPEPEVQPGDISTRFGGSGSSDLAVNAVCEPELQTVELDLPIEANTMFYPKCIRVEQCGGCCFGPLLTCRPTETKVVKYKVLKTIATPTSRRNNRRRRRQNNVSYHEVDVVKHTACKCGCRVQESDCIPAVHTYHEGECACICKNKDEKTKCENQNSTKYWDEKTCACYCHNPLTCGSGEYFNQATCRCDRVAVRSGFVDEGRRRRIHPGKKPLRVSLR